MPDAASTPKTFAHVQSLEIPPAGFVIGERADLDNKAYHAGPGISSSALKLALVSPLHYHDYYHLGGREEAEAEQADRAAAFSEGSLFHSLVLEPNTVEGRYLIHDDLPDGRTKEGKAAREALRAEVAATKKEPISKEAFTRISEMAGRARSFPMVDALLRGGVAERSIFWIDEETGLLCKARPDYLLLDKGIITDLKSAADAADDQCSRHLFDFDYFVSAAWYLHGASKVYNRPFGDFVLLFQEKRRPFAPNIFQVDQEAINAGHLLCRKAIRTIHACIQSGKWPGYSDKIRPLALPPWALKKIKDTTT